MDLASSGKGSGRKERKVLRRVGNSVSYVTEVDNKEVVVTEDVTAIQTSYGKEKIVSKTMVEDLG
jgi:hypothetical protein